MAANSNRGHHLTVRKGPAEIPQDPSSVFSGSLVVSHFFNAMSLLFPRGEEFFIDSVRKFVNRTPPELKNDVKAFIGQEAMHGKVHRGWNNKTQANGYDVSLVATLMDKALGNFDRLDFIHPALGLSMTAALEHVTATQSAWFLRHPEFVNRLEASARDITLWHSCEEIEHRHVAFDLLKAVDDSYALRIGGHLFGQVLLWGSAFFGLGLILSQEKSVTVGDMLADLRENLPGLGEFTRNNIEQFFEYFRPDFHPEDDDSRPLAAAYLAEKKIA